MIDGHLKKAMSWTVRRFFRTSSLHLGADRVSKGRRVFSLGIPETGTNLGYDRLMRFVDQSRADRELAAFVQNEIGGR
jgi:hypothetical protein